MVYAGLKYLLPLWLLFSIGYTLALILRPTVRFLSLPSEALAFFGRTWQLPSGLIGAAEMALIFAGLGFLAWQGILRLCREIQLLTVRLPLWLDAFDRWITDSCGRLERAAGLDSGCLSDAVGEMALTLGEKVKEALCRFSWLILSLRRPSLRVFFWSAWFHFWLLS